MFADLAKKVHGYPWNSTGYMADINDRRRRSRARRLRAKMAMLARVISQRSRKRRSPVRRRLSKTSMLKSSLLEGRSQRTRRRPPLLNPKYKKAIC